MLHLYQNVYGHKATRGAETVFFALMSEIMRMQRAGESTGTGLSDKHPVLRFASDPSKVAHVLDLDDAVFWGALPQLVDAPDHTIAKLATRIRDRRLPKCVDIRRRVEEALPPPLREELGARKERLGRIKLICGNVLSALDERQTEIPLAKRVVLVDEYVRSPYRRFDSGRTPMNQIHIRDGGTVRDVAELSAVVAGAEPFEICRAYDFSDDNSGREMVENIIGTEMKGVGHGHT